MSLEITGKLKELKEVQTGISKAGKEWKKQNFIVSNDDGYQGAEQIYCFEVFGDEAVSNLSKFNKVNDNIKVSFNIKTNEWKDKCEMLDKYQVGQNVKVGINLRGREWTSPKGEVKYFNSIQGWRIDKVDGASAPEPLKTFSEQETSDLPF